MLMLTVSSICISIMLSIIVLLLINWIGKEDNTVLLPSTKEKVVLVFGIIICSVSMVARYGVNAQASFYAFILAYLILSAYVDKKTMDVYCIFNYVVAFIGMCYYGVRWYHVWTQQGALSKINAKQMIMALLVFFLMLLIAKGMHLYSSGDGEIFFAISFYVMADGYGYDNLYRMYICYVLALMLITLSNLDKIDWKNKRLREPRPFAPSICLATFIILLLG